MPATNAECRTQHAASACGHACRIHHSSFIIHHSRAAFTLIEMLVTVTIMLILVTATVTMFRPANEERRIREAARAINVYLGSARNRAMETGRPCGVMFRLLRSATPPHGAIIIASMNADQCEVPACYCGETEQSKANVALFGTGIKIDFHDGSGTAESLPEAMVRPGDLIQFNAQGPMYALATPSASGISGNLDATNTYYSTTSSVGAALQGAADGQMMPWTATPQSVTYRIYRSPVKGYATPLQLPATTVVDMNASGFGNATQFNTGGDIIVLFAPTGGVEQVSIGGAYNAVTEPIYLLVGKRERVGNGFTQNNPNEQTLANYQDLNNLWVVINPHTGLVTTENVASSAGASDEAAAIAASRTLAAKAEGIGGR